MKLRKTKLAQNGTLLKKKISRLPSGLYTQKQIDHLVEEFKDQGLVGTRTTVEDFLEAINARQMLLPIKLDGDPVIVRYANGIVNPIQVALSIGATTHLSHWTALHLHGLLNKSSPFIYVTWEQGKKPYQKSSQPDQTAVDRAFSNPQRVSNTIYKWKDYPIQLLKGKYSEETGIIMLPYEGSKLAVTDIERTLIDCTVRPGYAGGIPNLIDAFKAARDKVSVEKLYNHLKTLDFIYPYHQSLGFLMQHTAYPPEELKRFKALPRKIRFYLDYAMHAKVFNEEWNIYIPRELKVSHVL